ncbi:hypothetical protein PVT67_04225 [Gallaecimonas kandeliae]|uniref:hypothetical protein n=1 Tax=Gallaecimonas kandeliae TaxID=3029055 RepID=UPI002648726D|nr:hypothetical protein [Gallaecimonas kandeliae]WKE66463.1 hypothetical protein PVT67_04225 [Gallaecimonas kandeliae]
MSRLFLLPLVLCLLWWLAINYFRIPLSRGKVGFYWILGLSALLIAFMSLMLWVTSYQQ